MDSKSSVLKVLIGILAVIGLLTVLAVGGMAVMHGGMTGMMGTGMGDACRSMMGWFF